MVRRVHMAGRLHGRLHRSTILAKRRKGKRKVPKESFHLGSACPPCSTFSTSFFNFQDDLHQLYPELFELGHQDCRYLACDSGITCAHTQQGQNNKQ